MYPSVNKPVYDFRQKRAEADADTRRIAAWFNEQDYIRRAIPVQNIQRYFYHGDIYLKFGQPQFDGFLEVKIETRTTRHTPNFAIERWSKTEQQIPGGIWSSQGKYYAHLFADGYFFIIARLRLLPWIESQAKSFKSFSAKNPDYTTSGYLVPRQRVIKHFQSYLGVYQL